MLAHKLGLTRCLNCEHVRLTDEAEIDPFCSERCKHEFNRWWSKYLGGDSEMVRRSNKRTGDDQA